MPENEKPPAMRVDFYFAQCSVFISFLGSKNARYGPGVFRFERPFSAEGIFIASLLREVARLAATEGVFLSVVSLALSFSSLTPSVAYGASSLGEGAFRDGGSGPREGAFPSRLFCASGTAGEIPPRGRLTRLTPLCKGSCQRS